MVPSDLAINVANQFQEILSCVKCKQIANKPHLFMTCWHMCCCDCRKTSLNCPACGVPCSESEIRHDAALEWQILEFVKLKKLLFRGEEAVFPKSGLEELPFMRQETPSGSVECRVKEDPHLQDFYSGSESSAKAGVAINNDVVGCEDKSQSEILPPLVNSPSPIFCRSSEDAPSSITFQPVSKKFLINERPFYFDKKNQEESLVFTSSDSDSHLNTIRPSGMNSLDSSHSDYSRFQKIVSESDNATNLVRNKKLLTYRRRKRGFRMNESPHHHLSMQSPQHLYKPARMLKQKQVSNVMKRLLTPNKTVHLVDKMLKGNISSSKLNVSSASLNDALATLAEPPVKVTSQENDVQSVIVGAQSPLISPSSLSPSLPQKKGKRKILHFSREKSATLSVQPRRPHLPPVKAMFADIVRPASVSLVRIELPMTPISQSSTSLPRRKRKSKKLLHFSRENASLTLPVQTRSSNLPPLKVMYADVVRPCCVSLVRIE